MDIFLSSCTGLTRHCCSGVVRYVVTLFAVVILATGLGGCGGETEEVGIDVRSKPELVSVDVPLDHAKGFSLRDHDGFKTLRVTVDLDGHRDTLRYLLLPRKSSRPDGFDEYVTIRTPVNRIALFSTTHVGYVDLLGCSDRIVGIARPEYVNTPALRKRIEAGAVSEIGMSFSPNLEVLLDLDPDLLVATALPKTRKTGYNAIVDAGVPVLVVSEWLESSPLGRAEWLKMYGALLGKDDSARRTFEEIEASYIELAALTRDAVGRPSVITGIPYKDAWFVPGGGSYVAEFLRDAGAAYHWRDNPKTGSIKQDIETVYPVALEADYWLNPGTARSLEELLAKDRRFADFRPVRSGKVHNNNLWLNPAGGNAYWEMGIVRPEKVLRDLILILHPDIAAEAGIDRDSLTFYRHLQ